MSTVRERLRRQCIELWRLREKSDIDPLTGLFVRAYAMRKLKQLPASDRRVGSYGLVMVDLDHFKLVNDTHGHAAGDEVLRRVGGLLKANTRDTDTPFRYGGEELGVLFASINPEHLDGKIEQIRSEVERLRFDRYPALRVTASFGLCIIDPKFSMEENLRRVDEALYASKHGGRNRVTPFQQARRAA